MYILSPSKTKESSSKKYSKRAKLLYKFLKRKRVLKEYVDNVIDQHNPKHYPMTKRYLESHDILQLIEDNKTSIDYSFIWGETLEGQDFWNKLDIEFEVVFVTKYDG